MSSCSFFSLRRPMGPYQQAFRGIVSALKYDLGEQHSSNSGHFFNPLSYLFH